MNPRPSVSGAIPHYSLRLQRIMLIIPMKTFHGAAEHVHTKIHSRVGVFSDVDRAYEGMTQTPGVTWCFGSFKLSQLHI